MNHVQILGILASFVYRLNRIHFNDEILCFDEKNIRLTDYFKIEWEGFQ
jgi:hypothetical protein